MTLEFSEDRGLSYQPGTITGTTRYLATQDGVTAEVLWLPSTDLAVTTQADLRVRVTPYDTLTGQTGTPVASAVFGFGANTAPIVHWVDTPVGVQGGEIAFEYVVSDLNGDVVGVLLEYSINDGVSWANATAGTLGQGASAVTTTVAGTDRVVSWDAQSDLADLVSTAIQLRITPVDVETGTAAHSGSFSVNLAAPAIALTVGGIPPYLNGSEPYFDDAGASHNFRLSVPTYGYQLKINYQSAGAGGLLDLSTLNITCSRPTGSAPAGTNLASLFEASSTQAVCVFGAMHALPAGEAIFRTTIQDEYGNVSSTAELALFAIAAAPSHRPFDWVDNWHVDFTTDFFTDSVVSGAVVTVTTISGSNGEADFNEDLQILGLRSEDPTAGCIAIDSNSRLLDWARTEVLGRLHEHYGRNFDGSGAGFHENLRFSTNPVGTSSVIRVGGDDLNTGYTLGRAHYDYRNAGGNNNRSGTLGVFVTNMIQYYINSSYSFRLRFDPLIPGRGTPAGEHALDADVLHPAFDRLDPENSGEENARYDEIASAMDAIGRSVAAIVAHEIGHSLGLVALDAPPVGLFGGVTGADFSGTYTTPYHLDTPGNNLMAAALSFTTSLIATSLGYRFNGLNEAYLREWVVLH
ncbi:MAG: hypothetical protein ACKVX7_12400 [Planctomycetota bacterium]